MKKNPTIAIIGLGYVGLPLAVAFAEKYKVIGYDIDAKRVDQILAGDDQTMEVSRDELRKVLDDSEYGLMITHDSEQLTTANVFIVTVPTPTNKHNQPVLTPLKNASETVGKVLKAGDVVIYESTVYPGVTEDICVPILEENSELKFNNDFIVPVQ